MFTAPMEMLIQSASSFSHEIDFVIVLILLLTGFWLFVAEAALIGFAIKFRRSKNPKAMYITGEKKEEKKYIAVPHYLILVCDVFILFFAVKAWYNIKQDLPTADETIRVIGQQWSWRFIHPGKDSQLGTEDDVETVDELHVKLDKTYHFKLEATDVLHSFSVPVFRLKQDAIPGRVITGWFKPTKAGEFDVQCAEMCGIGHGIMGGRIFVESENDHNQWLDKMSQNRT